MCDVLFQICELFNKQIYSYSVTSDTETTQPVPVQIPPPSYQATYRTPAAASRPACEIKSTCQIDPEFVLKFSRICAPVCQIMSIAISMYFWHVLLVLMYLSSQPSSAEFCQNMYYFGEVSLFVGGLFCLLALFIAFIKKCPCMLSPFAIYQYISCTLVTFGVIAQIYYVGMLSFGGILFIIFFAAFLFFANYTLCQVMRLRKLMAMKPVNRTGGGTTYFVSPEGAAVPVYPGATMPMGTPIRGNWTVTTSSS
jgi:hypothetical protein